MSKYCYKCYEIKPLTEFNFRRDTYKYRNECKQCYKLRGQKYYQQNKEHYKELANSYKPIRNEIRRNRYHNDSNYKISECLKTRFHSALKSNIKAEHSP